MMPSLTNIAQLTRKAFVFLFLLLVASIFLYIIFSFVIKTVNSLKPVPPPNLSPTYGKLPKTVFPQQVFPKDLKFIVETISGNLPSASATAKVFFSPKKQQGLLANIKAIEDAKKIGFANESESIDKKLVFKNSGFEFIIDPITRNFTYNYDYQNDQTVFYSENLLTKNSVIAQARAFLDSLNALPDDYDSDNPQVTFLTFNGAQFIPTTNEKDDQNATAARIDYFRKKFDNFQFVTPKNNQGDIYVIVSKSKEKTKQIIKAERNYQEISFENFGIYPVKNVDSAWDEFINGNGYIAKSGNSTFTKRVVIRDAFLAYYDDPEKHNYFLPIYVFIGDDQFVGYAEAISSEWQE